MWRGHLDAGRTHQRTTPVIHKHGVSSRTGRYAGHGSSGGGEPNLELFLCQIRKCVCTHGPPVTLAVVLRDQLQVVTEHGQTKRRFLLSFVGLAVLRLPRLQPHVISDERSWCTTTTTTYSRPRCSGNASSALPRQRQCRKIVSFATFRFIKRSESETQRPA